MKIFPDFKINIIITWFSNLLKRKHLKTIFFEIVYEKFSIRFSWQLLSRQELKQSYQLSGRKLNQIISKYYFLFFFYVKASPKILNNIGGFLKEIKTMLILCQHIKTVWLWNKLPLLKSDPVMNDIFYLHLIFFQFVKYRLLSLVFYLFICFYNSQQMKIKCK